MWTAKLKLSDKQGVVGSRTIKYNVSLNCYLVSVKNNRKDLLIDIVGILFGNEDNKKRFISDLKKAKEVINLESNGDLIIAQMKDPKKFEPVYNRSIIQTDPVIIDDKGDNYYSVGSWNRNELNRFTNFVCDELSGELLNLKKTKLSNFSILSLIPNLTLKQNLAFELALKKGYYNYPRKINVKDLAKISDISFSAFHAHLRKAEKKLISRHM